MLLYLGSGPALAAYCRMQRSRVLTDCAAACAAALGQLSARFESKPDAGTRLRLARAIESMNDCRELCSLAAPLVERASDLETLALNPCAIACQRCAEACDALSPDTLAVGCASVCRRAESTCRQAALA
jgi:hypothetical protein